MYMEPPFWHQRWPRSWCGAPELGRPAEAERFYRGTGLFEERVFVRGVERSLLLE